MKHALKLSAVVLIYLAQISFADVAIIKTAGIASYDEARNGFSSICFENKKEFNLLEDLSNQNDITNQIKGGAYNLIVVMGTVAAKFAKDNFPNVPIVFCMVLNTDLNSLRADNITGVGVDVRIKDQFTVLRNINKKIKRIGIIYTQPANDPLVASARNIASELNMSVVTSGIAGSQDIQKAMNDVVDKIDALWIPPDPSLYSDEVIRYIGSTSLTKLIPCVGPNERYVRSGAIFSMSFDPVEAGRTAGDIANKILQGTPPSKLPVEELQHPKIIINTRAAGLLKLTIPKSIQDAANKVYQ
jgi:putative tryptophan/tyrosine transport system substrate-binding protein